MFRPKEILKLFLSVSICYLVGVIGSLFPRPAVEIWIVSSGEPFFSSAHPFFGPIWLVLYTFAGVALYLVLREGMEKVKVRQAFVFFLVHLLVNVLWSVAFFGFDIPLLALLAIALLWLMVAVLVFLFWRIRPLASCLLIPYWSWITFVGVLNFAIWRLG